MNKIIRELSRAATTVMVRRTSPNKSLLAQWPRTWVINLCTFLDRPCNHSMNLVFVKLELPRLIFRMFFGY